MGGLTTFHVPDGDYYGGLADTRAEKYQHTSLVGGNCTEKDNEVDIFFKGPIF